MTKRSDMRERLEDVHSFPGVFTFKVIGENTSDFVSAVVDVVADTLGEDVDPDVATRESSGGKHVSVTLDVEVGDADAVIDVYEAFGELEQVRFVL